MGRYVDGVEWKVMQAEEANRADLKRNRPKRKLVDMHDAGGLILLGVLVSPIVFGIVKWVLGM